MDEDDEELYDEIDEEDPYYVGDSDDVNGYTDEIGDSDYYNADVDDGDFYMDQTETGNIDVEEIESDGQHVRHKAETNHAALFAPLVGGIVASRGAARRTGRQLRTTEVKNVFTCLVNIVLLALLLAFVIYVFL